MVGTPVEGKAHSAEQNPSAAPCYTPPAGRATFFLQFADLTGRPPPASASRLRLPSGDPSATLPAGKIGLCRSERAFGTCVSAAGRLTASGQIVQKLIDPSL